jgi:hypothetical protein
MKKITFTLAAIVLSTSALANSADDIKFCTSISTISTAIMTGRQEGIPLLESIKATQKAASKPEFADITEALMKIVQLAYKEPRFSSDKMKKETISEFANKITLQCLVEMKEQK